MGTQDLHRFRGKLLPVNRLAVKLYSNSMPKVAHGLVHLHQSGSSELSAPQVQSESAPNQPTWLVIRNKGRMSKLAYCGRSRSVLYCSLTLTSFLVAVTVSSEMLS